jgi:hypothetical protein
VRRLLRVGFSPECSLATSRFLPGNLPTSRFSGPYRFDPAFSCVTCYVLWYAQTPVDFARQRILTAYHPVSGTPSYSIFFGFSSLDFSRAFYGRCKQPQKLSVVLSGLATRLNGLCSHEHPDCDGPGYIIDGAVTPRPARSASNPCIYALQCAGH